MQKIRLGFIGTANQGTYNLKSFFALDRDCVVTALCDVDDGNLAKARRLVEEHYGDGRRIRTFHDFRDLNRWEGVDAVVITVPDHWHTAIAIDAARCGKDIYCEKPLTLFVAEGRRLCEVVAETGVIFQTGSQQRSAPQFRRAAELVRNGYLGKVSWIEVEIPPNNKFCEPTWEPMPVPEGFDYDLWLGPAPAVPYHVQRCHYQFRFLLDYSGGQVTNFGAHHLDIVQWALGMDDAGPVEAWGQGEFPTSGLFTTATKVDFHLRYACGAEVRCVTGDSKIVFHGEKGDLEVKRAGAAQDQNTAGGLITNPPELAQTELKPSDIHLYVSANHQQNFLDCIRSRKPCVCPAEVGHRSATCCHLANIAMRLGRHLQWDPAAERFVNDDEANAMLVRPYRAPWTL